MDVQVEVGVEVEEGVEVEVQMELEIEVKIGVEVEVEAVEMVDRGGGNREIGKGTGGVDIMHRVELLIVVRMFQSAFLHQFVCPSPTCTSTINSTSTDSFSKGRKH